MGYFDSTCALTRTGISGGDLVILVHTRTTPEEPNYAPERAHTYHLFSALLETVPSPKYTVVLGTYDGYGWLTLPNRQTYNAQQRTWLTPDDPHDQRLPFAHTFFVKQRVISHLFLNGQPVTDENKSSAVQQLASFAMRTRCQLFGDTHSLIGIQWVDEEEIELQQKLLGSIKDELRYLKAKL